MPGETQRLQVSVEAGPHVVSVSLPRYQWDPEELLPQQPLRLWGLSEKNHQNYIGFAGEREVRVVASADERREVRDERQDQQQHASADSRARIGQELGARYMLQGDIQAIEDQEGRERVVYYQIDATLVDLESNVKVWTGQHRIKKYITRPRLRF
jgi:hypothetical protein